MLLVRLALEIGILFTVMQGTLKNALLLPCMMNFQLLLCILLRIPIIVALQFQCQNGTIIIIRLLLMKKRMKSHSGHFSPDHMRTG